jgi:glycosyltransferase involved in cell wall biosynthesis
MKDYKVAVIIPTLNEERFIERCFDSVIHQTFPFKDMDVMVIDGGSTDNTCQIVSSLYKKYSNVRLIHNPGKIQSIAFNIGVQESTAPFIVRLDAHTTYSREYIEECLRAYSATKEELGFSPELLGNVGGVWLIRPQNSTLIAEASAILNQVRFGIGGASFRVGGTAGCVDTVPFGCFPRKVIETVGGMREDLARGEDNEINSRIRKAGYKVYFNPKVVCTYFSRATICANVKQMYANGLSIGRLLYLDRDSVRFRHLVPLAFVMAIIGSMVLGFISYPMFILLAIILGVYLLTSAIATILACRKFGWKYIFVLPILFFLVHISYGLGTIIGITKWQ